MDMVIPMVLASNNKFIHVFYGMNRLNKDNRAASSWSASCVCFLLCGAMLLTDSSASEWNATAGAGLSYSDNLYRTSHDHKSDYAYDAYLGLNGKQQGSRYSTSLASNLTFRKYSSDQNSEVLGAVTTSAQYSPLVNLLTISVTDTFGQYLASASQPEMTLDVPSNRLGYNILALGPSIYIPLGSRTKISTNAQWVNSTYEGSPYDTTRLQYGSELNYALSQSSSIYVTHSASRIKFDRVVASQMTYDAFDIIETGFGFTMKTAKSNMNLLAGRTSVKYPLDTKSPNTLFRGDLSRRIGKSVALLLSAGVSYEDSGSNYALSQNIYGIDSGSLTQALTNDAFKFHYANASINYSGSKNNLSLGINANRSFHSINTQLDYERQSLNLRLSHRFSQRIDIDFGSDFGKQKFTANASTYNDWSFGASLRWHLTKNADINFGLSHNHGSQTGAFQGAQSYNYNENTARLALMYLLGR